MTSSWAASCNLGNLQSGFPVFCSRSKFEITVEDTKVHDMKLFEL